MAPSTYYDATTRPPSARARRDAVLGPALQKLWEDNYGVYGAVKLWKAARRAGALIGARPRCGGCSSPLPPGIGGVDGGQDGRGVGGHCGDRGQTV